MSQVINAEATFKKRRKDISREKKIERLNLMNQVFTEVALYVQEVQTKCHRVIDELDVLAKEIAALEEEILDGK